MSWSADLLDILLLEMPTPRPKKEGFMDILDIQYHENSITRIYSYFLDQKRNPDLAALFLDSLLQVIRSKAQKELAFESYICQLERQTDKGNRIDLVIKTGGDNFEPDDQAIIIENKIFSGVGNDLVDYWHTAKTQDERKVGVLLTLTKTKVPDAAVNYFINITHNEWIDQIKTTGLPFDLDGSLYVYVTDFLKNMGNILSTSGLTEDAHFFFEYPDKVLRAMKIYEAARTHAISQFKILGEKLELDLHGNSEAWRHLWDHKSQVYYVLGFGSLLTPSPSITVYLEVYQDGVTRQEELRKLLTETGAYSQVGNDGKSTKSWVHLAFKEYTLSKDDIQDLATFLYEKIQHDFARAYLLVSQRLDS